MFVIFIPVYLFLLLPIGLVLAHKRREKQIRERRQGGPGRPLQSSARLESPPSIG